MNLLKIKQAIHTIDRAEAALKWLTDQAPQVDAARFDSGPDGIQYHGHSEAKDYLSSALNKTIPDLIASAKVQCETDIAAAQKVIRNEALVSAVGGYL